MSLLPKDIEDRLIAYIREDVECDEVGDGDRRLGCMTPLEYPTGDNVTVWVTVTEGGLEVSDFGEATSESVLGGRAPSALTRIAQDLARMHGVTYDACRLTASCSLDTVGEWVWRVALVASELSHAALTSRRQRVNKVVAPHQPFSAEVAVTLLRREVHVVRHQLVEGSSGHKYETEFYVPESEAILEPIRAKRVQEPEVASAYLKFGDLRNANGYQLFSLLDDREHAPHDEVGRLLTQVSTVVWWSRSEDWLAGIAPR